MSKYNRSIGLRISVDGAQNLPLKKPTLAIASFCPVGVLYDPFAKEPVSSNNVQLYKKLVMTSSLRAPCFADGYKVG